MVQRTVTTAEKLLEHFTVSQTIDILGDYLKEKREKKNKEYFMNPRTYVCYRAMKQRKEKNEKEDVLENLNQEIGIDLVRDYPEHPYQGEFPLSGEWWEDVPHIITMMKEENKPDKINTNANNHSLHGVDPEKN